MTPEATLDAINPAALDAITQAVIDRIADRILTIPALRLTSQELRIAILLGRGWSMGQISAELGLKHPSDIGNRVRTCCQKHGIRRHQLAVYGAFLAIRKGEL